MKQHQVLLRSDALSFGYRVGYVSNVFSGPVYKLTEQKYGIQRPMFAILFCVAHADNLTATDVCTLSGIGKKTISRAVKALEGKGLLRRRPNPEDSRSALLKLTAAGRRMYGVILALLQARQQEMVAPLSAREQEVLVALFDKLIDRSGEAENY